MIVDDLEHLIEQVLAGNWATATHIARTLDPKGLAVVQASDAMLEALREIAEISRGLRFATGLNIQALANNAITQATTTKEER